MSLNLLKDMNAVGLDLAKVIRAKLSEWDLHKSSILYEAEDEQEIANEDEQDIDNNTETFVSEADHEETESGEGAIIAEKKYFNDDSDDKKKMRKRYKKSITEVLAESGNRMKKKKLKGKVVQLSSQYDKREDDVRKEMFEKYLTKVKDVVVGKKYVIIVE